MIVENAISEVGLNSIMSMSTLSMQKTSYICDCNYRQTFLLLNKKVQKVIIS